MEHNEAPNKIQNLIFILLVVLGVLITIGVINGILNNSTYIVNGNSMHPFLKDGDNVIALPYLSLDNGDVVLIHRKESYIVKRIIGKGNDTIEITNSKILVNGIEEVWGSDDSYEDVIGEYRFLENYTSVKKSDSGIKFIVPEGLYFVLGDNRLESIDSRYSSIGFVRKENIILKVSQKVVKD